MPWLDPSDPVFAWLSSNAMTVLVGALGIAASVWIYIIGKKSTDRMLAEAIARIESSAVRFNSSEGGEDALEDPSSGAQSTMDARIYPVERPDGTKESEVGAPMLKEEVETMATPNDARRVVWGRLERAAKLQKPIPAGELLAGVAGAVLRPVLGDLYLLKFRRVISWDEADLAPDSIVRVVGRLPASNLR